MIYNKITSLLLKKRKMMNEKRECKERIKEKINMERKKGELEILIKKKKCAIVKVNKKINK